MQTTNRKIRVLVVDDSAVARSVIIQGLSASPRIEVVGYAVNAMDAKTKLQHLSPDVMTLDVEMPGINGINFLKQFLPSHPLPVILVSSLNLRVFDALAAGAVDFVRKPDAVESRESFLQALTHKIIVASHARFSRANLPHPAAYDLGSQSGRISCMKCFKQKLACKHHQCTGHTHDHVCAQTGRTSPSPAFNA